MKFPLIACLALLATPTLAQAPNAGKTSDPSAGNSIQCWDTQKFLVRDRDTGGDVGKNDTSGVGGQKVEKTTRNTPSSSPPMKTPTAEEAANAKRPPGIADC